MACRLSPVPLPMLTCCQLRPKQQTSVKNKSKFKHFHSRKYVLSHRLRNGSHFGQGEMSKIKTLNIYRWHGTCVTSVQSWFYLGLIVRTRLIPVPYYRCLPLTIVLKVLCLKCIFLARIFHRSSVPIVATSCPCCAWGHVLATGLLHVCPPFGNTLQTLIVCRFGIV